MFLEGISIRLNFLVIYSPKFPQFLNPCLFPLSPLCPTPFYYFPIFTPCRFVMEQALLPVEAKGSGSGPGMVLLFLDFWLNKITTIQNNYS